MKISLDNVSKAYGAGARRQRVLENISLTIEPGNSVALVGRSGSGKSTLLNLIGGLEQPDNGVIRFGDAPMNAGDDAVATLLRRRHVGFVFQFFNLIPTLTALENAALPLELNGCDAAEGRHLAAANAGIARARRSG